MLPACQIRITGCRWKIWLCWRGGLFQNFRDITICFRRRPLRITALLRATAILYCIQWPVQTVWKQGIPRKQVLAWQLRLNAVTGDWLKWWQELKAIRSVLKSPAKLWAMVSVSLITMICWPKDRKLLKFRYGSAQRKLSGWLSARMSNAQLKRTRQLKFKWQRFMTSRWKHR